MATILIVDDEQPIREILAELFRGAGHRTVVAEHGRRALELVEEARPDLVISDVMMPVLDGAALCRRLKARPGADSIPVILMGAAGRRSTDGLGADAFIDKPFTLDAIEALARQWLPPDAADRLPTAGP